MKNIRLEKLQNLIKHPVLIKKKENLLYLTGRSFMYGYLLVKKNGAVFFGDGLERIEGIESDFLKNIGQYVGPRETLEVFGEFTYAEVKYIKFKNPKLKVKVVIKHDPVDRLRAVKDGHELELIRTNMRMVEKVFAQVKKQLKKKSWTETGLADFIKSAGFKLGAEDVSFPPIVASGPNAAVPHHVPSTKKLKAGESIILDFGFKYKGYCSDFTRTVFIKKVPAKLEAVYNQAEKAYWESMNFIGSGRGQSLGAGKIYQKAVDVLAEKKLDKYFIHSLGHGSGLEIHELPNLSPKSRDILQKGMVFSIEPGVYIPKLSGVRIEDLVYLEESGAKRFISVPTKIEDNIIK